MKSHSRLAALFLAATFSFLAQIWAADNTVSAGRPCNIRSEIVFEPKKDPIHFTVNHSGFLITARLALTSLLENKGYYRQDDDDQFFTALVRLRCAKGIHKTYFCRSELTLLDVAQRVVVHHVLDDEEIRGTGSKSMTTSALESLSSVVNRIKSCSDATGA